MSTMAECTKQTTLRIYTYDNSRENCHGQPYWVFPYTPAKVISLLDNWLFLIINTDSSEMWTMLCITAFQTEFAGMSFPSDLCSLSAGVFFQLFPIKSKHLQQQAASYKKHSALVSFFWVLRPVQPLWVPQVVFLLHIMSYTHILLALSWCQIKNNQIVNCKGAVSIIQRRLSRYCYHRDETHRHHVLCAHRPLPWCCLIDWLWLCPRQVGAGR